MHTHNDAFETFWKLVRSSILWGSIVRGTRHNAEMVRRAFPRPLTHEQASLIAKTFNDIPEDFKTSESTITSFLKYQTELLQCIQNIV